MTTQKRELLCLNTAQKSFYKKAIIIETIGELGERQKLELKSYNTIVASISFMDNVQIDIFGKYSRTTWRHIREFILQNVPVKYWNTICYDFGNGVKRWFYNA